MKPLIWSLLAIVLSAGSVPAYALDYIHANDNGKSVTLLDKGSFARVDASTMRGLSIDVFRDAAMVNGTKRKETMIYAKCADSKYGVKSMTFFDKSGKPLFNRTNPDPDVEYSMVGPESVAGWMVAQICATQTAGADEIVRATSPDELQQIFDKVFASEASQ